MGVALLILGFIWGSSFILMKVALFDTQGQPLFPALDVAMGRIAIAGFALLPLAAIHRKHLNRNTLPWLILVGGIGNLLPAYLFTTAQIHIPSSVAGMLNALTPMFTFFLGVALFGTQIRRLQVIGLVVGLFGAAVLAFQPGVGASLNSTTTWGAGLVVLATACYGISVNLIRNKLGHIPAAAAASLSLGLMSVPACAVALTGPGMSLATTHPDGMRGVIAVVVLAVVGTGLALIAFNRIIQKTNALFASTVTYIIPLFATMWGWLDDEPLTSLHLVGGAVVLIGVYLVSQGGK